jgi:serine/threonine protein kinase/Tol biopolymer transport system component
VTLSAGTRIGHYEVLGLLGAGGMGEVYRAKDPRLGREVALKVLPASIAQDADRLRRFESEARAASALNHPNIVTVHDIGKSNGTAFMAMELIDGTSLRQMLASGPLPEKKMLEVSVQIADGLAKAHSAGILHRDLKPENVMVSRDGFVKVLDFGLAKPFTAPGGDGSAIPTMAGETQPGTVLGTVGYMSPEQASGRPVDYRSDQFSLGSILYEMATGQRAFQKPTGAETLSAIIREEPEPVSRVNPRAPAPYRWIVERCLAKDPEDRYISTRDLARDLKSVREHVSEVTSSASGATPVSAAPRRRVVAWWLAVATLVLGAVGGALLERRMTKTEPPSFTQLTFRRGNLGSARFGPDGQTILYSASWEGKPMEVFVSRLDTPESRPFGLPKAELLSVSRSGEMAVSVDRRDAIPFNRTGTLARIGMTGGGTPKEFLEDILWADWAPDGQNLAVVRQQGGKLRLEYPVGKVLYETAGWISHPRISAGGDEVAFLDHPLQGDDSGVVTLVDRSGKRKALTDTFESAQGLCWSADGKEVLFSATSTGNSRALQAVTRSGRLRVLARGSGSFTVQDVSKTGRVLLVDDKARKEMSALVPGSPKERDFSWLDWSLPKAISSDGQMMLFDETGVGGGLGYSVYVRKADGSPAVRLGSGVGADLSPDGRLALGVAGSSAGRHLVLYPIGVGEPRALAPNGLRIDFIQWLPDGRGFVFSGAEPERGSRLWVQGIDDPKPRAFSPEGYRMNARSPDGKLVAAVGPDRRIYLYPIAGGEPTPIPGMVAGDVVGGWRRDGRSLFVRRRGEVPLRVMTLDLASGRKDLWKELMPADPAGVSTIAPVLITPDEKSYVYSYTRTLGDLYVVDGVK